MEATSINFDFESSMNWGQTITSNFNEPNNSTDQKNLIMKTIFGYDNFQYKNVILKTINENHNPSFIPFNITIEYNDSNSYVTRKEMVMIMEIDYCTQIEIDKIIKKYRNVNLIIFAFSILLILLAWNSQIVSEGMGLIIKPLSVAFSSMILINYFLRSVK